MQVSLRSGCLIRECSPLWLCSCSQPVTPNPLVHILTPIFPSMGSLQTGNTQTGFLDSLSCTHGSDCNFGSFSLEVTFANVQRCQYSAVEYCKRSTPPVIRRSMKIKAALAFTAAIPLLRFFTLYLHHLHLRGDSAPLSKMMRAVW